MEKVKALEEELRQKFGDDLGIRFGLGANTDEWLKIPPDEKGEPDLTLFYKYKRVCYIDVSGSDKVTMTLTGDIWVRPDKFNEAKKRTEETWFYMVYKNAIYVLDRKTIEPYEGNIKIVHIKRNQTGRRIPEKYISIPCSEAYPKEEMFQWIEQKIATIT